MCINQTCLGLSRLNIRAIVEHIMQVLRNDFSKDVFASEYTKLLVKDVLSVRKYCSEMPVELWNGRTIRIA